MGRRVMTVALVWLAMASLMPSLMPSLMSSLVFAQPDPFDDYEQGQRGNPQDAPLAGGDAGVIVESGSLTLGLAGVFAFTRSAGEGIEGDERVETTFFTRLSPSVGWMIFDGLELCFSPGLAWRRVQRGEDETTTERAVLLRGGVRYQTPLDSRLLAVLGAELGGYVGGSERPLAMSQDARIVSEATDTSGFTAAFEVGLGVVLDPRVVLDLGLTVDVLTGSETISSEDASLASSLIHTGLRAGLRVFF